MPTNTNESKFIKEIVDLIRSGLSKEELTEKLQDYHDNDIAQSLKYLNRAERNLLYSALDAEWLAEIISYIDDPVEYVDEIGIDKATGKTIVKVILVKNKLVNLIVK